MYYCFNENCNLWGTAASKGMLLTWPTQGKFGPCDECGEPVIWHDNWESDQRYHDNGEKVTE